MNTIIDQFQEIPTTCISDALQGLTNMDPDIKPLKEEYRVAGRAFTVKMPVGDNLAVFKAIREAKPGDILVIDAKGDRYHAIAGDFVIGMAKALGIQGIIVDGSIRDLIGIKQLDFPVFSRGTTIAASVKTDVGEINVTITCGGATVQAGDIIIGDADGVVVVPKALEQEVLIHAMNKLDQDNKRAVEYSDKLEKIIHYLDGILAASKSQKKWVED